MNNYNFPLLLITLDINNSTNILIKDKYVRIIINSLIYCGEKFNFQLLHYVIMPDHIHFIIEFNNEIRLEIIKVVGLGGDKRRIKNKFLKEFLKIFKSYTGFQIIKLLKKEKSILLQRFVLKKEKARKHYFSFWKDEEYITIINNKRALERKIQYIYNNPIKAGLVKDVKDYKYIK